jgi:hydroxymethylglutaryl-CoA lyase
MADNAEVMAGIQRRAWRALFGAHAQHEGLRGGAAGPGARPDEIVVFGAASEAFSQRNINCSIAESIERFAPVVQAARARASIVRGAMSCTVGCPYEGEIAPERVGCLAGLMKDIGVQHVGVADTIGVGTPRKVQRAMEATLQHYAWTMCPATSTTPTARRWPTPWPHWRWASGSSTPRSAGLGGCPYAKGATGNVATEDVVYMLHGMGIETGIDLDRLMDAGAFISEQLGASPTRVRPRRC